MLSRFGAVDAYLVTVLNRAGATAVDLSAWPAIEGWMAAMLTRPSVRRALGEELELYKAKKAAAPAGR